MKRYVLAGLLVTSLSLWPPRPAPGRGCRDRLRQPRRADHPDVTVNAASLVAAGPLPRRVRSPP